MRMSRSLRATSLLAAALLSLAGCETLLDDHDKVDADFCADYKDDDECCSEDDPCDLEDDLDCDCWGCGWDEGDCTMSWLFADSCDDGYAIDIGVYQVGDDGWFDEAAGDPHWDGFVLEELSEQYEFLVPCEPGEYTCWGGWSDSGTTWGCGKDCQAGCPDCCYYCDLEGWVSLSLTC